MPKSVDARRHCRYSFACTERMYAQYTYTKRRPRCLGMPVGLAVSLSVSLFVRKDQARLDMKPIGVFCSHTNSLVGELKKKKKSTVCPISMYNTSDVF